MHLGIYNAILYDRDLAAAIEVVRDLGLTGLEINTGGFLPATQVPAFDEILGSDAARDEFLSLFEGSGIEVAGLNCNWQQMDPVAVVRHLGPLVFHAAAKDVRVNAEHAALYGVLDNRFRRLDPSEPRVNLGGDEWVNEWPKGTAWDFVALRRGHDVAYWTEFLRALHDVDPENAGQHRARGRLTRPHRGPRGRCGGAEGGGFRARDFGV